MKCQNIKYGLLVLLFLFQWIKSYGQVIVAEDTPKVGLVLSGGGAKGFAHIGVLKVMEEVGLRPDYIAGTSMGAIVGGFYAAGWTADQIDSIFRNIDISALIADETPREIKPIFEKKYGEKYILSLTVKDFKINIPSAISAGQAVFNLLNKVTYPVRHIRKFDQLPIPFFCIGTDVVTGDAILMEEGNLAQAIRASGAFPGLFAPFKVGKHLLTDGGVSNNFPAKELKAKGMDVIIGVFVGDDPYTAGELGSIDKIIEQIGSFKMLENSKLQMKYCDILMRPDIKGYGVTSFQHLDSIKNKGVQAANKVKQQLLQLSQQKASDHIDSIPSNKYYNVKKDSLSADEVNVVSNPVYSSSNVLEFFPDRFPTKFTMQDFTERIMHIYGTGYFHYLDYDFEKNEKGVESITIAPIPKIGFDRKLKVGLHYDNVFKSSVLLNVTLNNLAFPNSTLGLNVILGNDFRYTLNYLIDRGKGPDFGLNSQLFLSDVPVNIDDPIGQDSSFQIQQIVFRMLDFSNELILRIAAGNNYELALSGKINQFDLTTRQIKISDGIPFIGVDGWSTMGSLSFLFDSRKERYFTKKGLLSHFKTSFNYPLEEEAALRTPYQLGYNVDYSWQLYMPLSDRFSYEIGGDIGFLFGAESPQFFYFLGGNNQNFINNFKAFVGLPYSEKIGTNLLSLKTQLQYEVLNNHFISLSGQFGYLDEFQNNTHFFNEPLYGLGLAYGILTPIGPIQGTIAFAEEGHQFYLNIGHWF